jgi:hypothetical protein
MAAGEKMLGVASNIVVVDKIQHASGGTVGFFGTTPASQPATIADATNTTTTTSTTTALTTDLDSLRSKFNDLLSKLESLGILASA